MLMNKSINVWHSGGWDLGGQASNTVKGLLCTNTSTPGNWLNVTGGKQYDVVHFNFGLHDLVDAGSVSLDPAEGAVHVEIPQYKLNLAELYRRLSGIGKKLIWTSTTPCPNVTTSMGRTDLKVRAYNDAAKEALAAAAAAAGRPFLEDDLYAAVEKYCGRDYKTCSLQRPANVHFEPAGCELMGRAVAQSVEDALLKK